MCFKVRPISVAIPKKEQARLQYDQELGMLCNCHQQTRMLVRRKDSVLDVHHVPVSLKSCLLLTNLMGKLVGVKFALLLAFYD